MKFPDAGTQDIDAIFIKTCMEKMDPDVATRFVLSALSLSKTKIEDAFALACREMAIREEDKKEKLAKETKANPELLTTRDTKDSEDLSTKSLIKLFEDILASATKKAK